MKKIKRYNGEEGSSVMSEDEADRKQTAVEDLVNQYGDMGPKSYAVPESKKSAPKRKPKAKFQNDESWREPVHIDAEAGMSRGSRQRFKGDEEARQAGLMAGYKPRYSKARSEDADIELKRQIADIAGRTSGGKLNPGVDAAGRSYRASQNASDAKKAFGASYEMKKGGAIKKYASGGMTASKRADGIAQRGKTRGTMVACGGGYMKGKK